MPKFAKENSLNVAELAQQEEKERVLSEKFKLDEQSNQKKSLYEQLQENKEREQAEYQNMLEERNSSHRLDEGEVAFYQELSLREQEKEMLARQSEMKELEKYKRLKGNHEVVVQGAPYKIAPPMKIVKRRKPAGIAKRMEGKLEKISSDVSQNKAKEAHDQDVPEKSKYSKNPALVSLTGYSSDDDSDDN